MTGGEGPPGLVTENVSVLHWVLTLTSPPSPAPTGMLAKSSPTLVVTELGPAERHGDISSWKQIWNTAAICRKKNTYNECHKIQSQLGNITLTFAHPQITCTGESCRGFEIRWILTNRVAAWLRNCKGTSIQSVSKRLTTSDFFLKCKYLYLQTQHTPYPSAQLPEAFPPLER